MMSKMSGRGQKVNDDHFLAYVRLTVPPHIMKRHALSCLSYDSFCLSPSAFKLCPLVTRKADM